MYRLLPRLHCVSGVWCANCWTHRMLVSAVCSWKITFILQRSSSRHVQFSVSQGISSEAQVLQNLPNEGILIFSMLHRYRRAKGDMKETQRYYWCQIWVPGGKREQNVWFNLFFPSVGEFRSWLTADVHLFKQNKDRVTLTYRFTFHSSAISRCQSLHCVFQQQQKELLARCLPEGRNPSLREKRSTGWIYSKGRVHLCSLL